MNISSWSRNRKKSIHIIGKGGRLLKEIGTKRARRISTITGIKFTLNCGVKVEKIGVNVKENPKEYGYRDTDYRVGWNQHGLLSLF